MIEEKEEVVVPYVDSYVRSKYDLEVNKVTLGMDMTSLTTLAPKKTR